MQSLFVDPQRNDCKFEEEDWRKSPSTRVVDAGGRRDHSEQWGLCEAADARDKNKLVGARE